MLGLLGWCFSVLWESPFWARFNGWAGPVAKGSVRIVKKKLVSFFLLGAVALAGGCDVSELLPGDVANSVRAYASGDCTGTEPELFDDYTVAVLYSEDGSQTQVVNVWNEVVQTNFEVHTVEMYEGSIRLWSGQNFQGDTFCLPDY